MSLRNDLGDRPFNLLVQGLIKVTYLATPEDPAAARAELRSLVFTPENSQMDAEAAGELETGLLAVLAQAGRTNASAGAMREILAETDLSEAHTELLLAAWGKHRTAVHQALVERACFERSQLGLARIGWRIDLECASKAAGAGLNEPMAVVELGLGGGSAGSGQNGQNGHNGQNGQGGEAILFEMDLATARQALDQFTAIQKRIAELA